MSGEGIALTAPSEAMMVGLYFIQRYRFLTVRQFASVTSLKEKSASEALLKLERQRVLDHFGNVGVRGYGKTPKVYYLKRRGYDLLVNESGIPPEMIGSFKETKINSKWSPQMYHRMATLDALISLEVAVQKRSHIDVVETFIEYRRVKKGTQWQAEMTDYVAREAIPQNRIVPDAGFIIENVESDRRALFLIEIDMGTERITSKLPHGKRFSILHKMTQYDRYLMGGRFSETYKQWGAFKFFTLLFVTTTAIRRDNMRREMQELPQELHPYYRFNILETVFADFFNNEWRARSITDGTGYRLIREQGT